MQAVCLDNVMRSCSARNVHAGLAPAAAQCNRREAGQACAGCIGLESGFAQGHDRGGRAPDAWPSATLLKNAATAGATWRCAAACPAAAPSQSHAGLE